MNRNGSDLKPQPLIDPAIDEAVHLAPYDARWPALFSAEHGRLVARFPELLRVEHFGSTAVPGMPAKPIIDILAGVASMAAADALFESLLGFGYTTSRAFNATLIDRRWFMRSTGGRRTHHLHVVVLGSGPWTERLHFRDSLRTDQALAQRYLAFKTELATKFEQDREAYTDAKSGFVAAVASSRR